jgi:hypothetical protein
MNFLFQYIDCTFRGVSASGDAGPWDEEDVSFTAQSDVTIQWNQEDSCGDGDCNNEPYPGENCMSCPDDCGTCNGRILPSDRSFLVEDSSLLTKDTSWGIQRTYYTGSSWSGWSQGNTNWEHVEVFENNNNFCAYVYPSSSAVGMTLNGECRVRPIYADGSKGAYIVLPQVEESWNDLGKTLSSSDCSDGVSGYWRTDWYENHRLVHNGKYELDVYYWLGGSPSPDPDPPQSPSVDITGAPPLIDPANEYAYVTYNHGDPDSSTVDTTISWGGDGVDTYQNEGLSQEYTRQHQTSLTYGLTHTGMTVTVSVEDDDGLTASDSIWISFWTGLEIVSTGLFSITDTNTDFEKYEYDGNVLGG